MMEWQTVIGLEIHVRLKTNSKIFSSASAQYGAQANANACCIDIALPGVLPVLNKQALQMIIAFGCAVDGDITQYPVMARKHYFYPDLPKGYQISQYEEPVVAKGKLKIALDHSTIKEIQITRAHLEEDAGKLIHNTVDHTSAVDLNRAGISLMEVVSEPEMSSSAEAVAYMKKIYSIVNYLDICDGNMQEGSFRCDVNVSVKESDAKELGTRAEIKNLNSFRFVEKAIDYEVNRQINLITDGGKVIQETRLFNADNGETYPMRSKEEANDYRYFPDPDLLPIEITNDNVLAIRKQLPELPDQKQVRFLETYHLSLRETEKLVADKDLANYFETCCEHSKADAKTVNNWISGAVSEKMNKENIVIQALKINAEALAGLLDLIEDETISGKIAKDVFDKMWAGEGSASEIIDKHQLRQISNSDELAAVIDQVIANNPKQVEQYRNGKEKILGYLVGQVMKLTDGKANPAQVNALLKQKL